jgi:hypothetical protein
MKRIEIDNLDKEEATFLYELLKVSIFRTKELSGNEYYKKYGRGILKGLDGLYKKKLIKLVEVEL